jgi:Transposase zinc-binding domain
MDIITEFDAIEALKLQLAPIECVFEDAGWFGSPVTDIHHFNDATHVYLARGSLSHGQRRAMSAIERCRSAALGGHLERCDSCGHQRVAYNSCRNRHCPKCQLLARARWLEHSHGFSEQEGGVWHPVPRGR